MLGFFNGLTHLADRDTFTALVKPCAASIGWSTPRSRSADPSGLSPISAANVLSGAYQPSASQKPYAFDRTL